MPRLALGAGLALGCVTERRIEDGFGDAAPSLSEVERGDRRPFEVALGDGLSSRWNSATLRSRLGSVAVDHAADAAEDRRRKSRAAACAR